MTKIFASSEHTYSNNLNVRVLYIENFERMVRHSHPHPTLYVYIQICTKNVFSYVSPKNYSHNVYDSKRKHKKGICFMLYLAKYLYQIYILKNSGAIKYHCETSKIKRVAWDALMYSYTLKLS